MQPDPSSVSVMGGPQLIKQTVHAVNFHTLKTILPARDRVGLPFKLVSNPNQKGGILLLIYIYMRNIYTYRGMQALPRAQLLASRTCLQNERKGGISEFGQESTDV